MNPIKHTYQIIGVFLVLSLLACTIPKQTQLLLSTKQSFPNSFELADTPFFAQTKFNCGPAALATTLNYQGKHVQPASLAPLVFIPQKKGSFQEEMVATARSYNILTVDGASNLKNIFKEVSNGYPVLVLQNLGLDWLPKWHYSVLIGYDLDKNQVILRSGETKRWVTPIDVFERTWERADYWALLITPINKLPITASSKQILNSALAYEELGKTKQAYQIYLEATKKWQKHALLHIGLGNTAYNLAKFQEAEHAFKQAIKITPNLAAYWNNLAYAQVKLGKTLLAKKSIEKAIKLASNKAPYIQNKQALFKE